MNVIIAIADTDAPGVSITADSWRIEVAEGAVSVGLLTSEAMAVADLWKAQNDDIHRDWILPDDKGCYDGIVFATGTYDGVSMTVWEPRGFSRAGSSFETEMFATGDFPFGIVVSAEATR